MRQFKKPYKHRRASRKDYSQRPLLGATPLTLPDNLFSVSRVLNQGATQSCTAYTSVAIRESMLPNQYNPELQWKAELDFMGVPDANGVDLQTALAVCVKTGFFKEGETTASDRASAYVFLRKRFGQDWFDCVRERIYLLWQKYSKVIPLSIGVNWYSDWDRAPNGIIPDLGKNLLGGHDVKVAGFEKYTIDNQDYILLQNSWGETFGDNGLYRVSRDVFNKWFDVYGAGYIVDDPDIQIQRYGFLVALLQNVIALYNSLLEKLKL